jgi:BioD-like phosphotransacetylase family protein
MSTLLIVSLQPGEGRTTTAAALGVRLAAEERNVRLLRVRSPEGADAAAEDDARTLAAVPGCASPRAALSEQEAHAEANSANAAGDVCIIETPSGETPPGGPRELADRLDARVVLVSAGTDELRPGDLPAAAQTLGDTLLGVVATRQPDRRLNAAEAELRERGLACLAALPEDRLLAGPNVREMAETLRASRLVEEGEEEEGLEYVMLGPISADPGQPYFLQHGRKATINRFDKMDLHLAALATEPDCLILTGGQAPSPYLLDRLAGSGLDITVLLSPEGTVRTVELLDELYGRTRFTGQRKLDRAVELFRERLDLPQLVEALR